MGADDEDRQGRPIALDVLDQLKPVAARHADVHHDEIPRILAHRCQAGPGITGLADFHALEVFLQQGNHATPDEGVIIDEENSHSGRMVSLWANSDGIVRMT